MLYSAYLDSDIDATRQAVYDKLKNTETKTSREIKGTQPVLLPGFRIKFLDRHCIEATEHRLKVLRNTKAGPLLGKSLIVFEPELGIETGVFPCENGHAQERSLLSSVIKTVVENDLWVADRHYYRHKHYDVQKKNYRDISSFIRILHTYSF